MRFLLDQGVPRSAVATLRARGHDAVHVGDIGLSTAADEEIVDRAVRDSRTVVTLDADFHTIIALSGARTPSAIRLRVEGLRAEPLAAMVERVAEQASSDIEAGALVSVDQTSVRVRRLPILKDAPG